LGEGALVESVACSGGNADGAQLQSLLSEALLRWLDSGLLFGLVPFVAEGAAPVRDALRQLGAALPPPGDGSKSLSLGVLRLANPLVLVWDVESALQPPFAAAPGVCDALAAARRAFAEFFAALTPGNALLHLHEEQLKRTVVEWAKELLGDQPKGRRWVALGLGRQFSRDIVGNCPTLAVDLERFLTWQGYEGGTFPLVGSPSLKLQIAVARELARNAVVLAPFLGSADAVVQVADAARSVGLPVREVLVGVTSASVRATLELRGIPHRCAAVLPGWQGVLRESAVTPYVGGWSILGREPLETGSLLPSLNDCLPYHYPHHLGLAGADALDFSRLAMRQARALLMALENAFREREGRLLAVQDLGAVVRTPRCPPLPQLITEDLEALARLHPETHAAHRERWRGR
jgi:hypothetical protein